VKSKRKLMVKILPETSKTVSNQQIENDIENYYLNLTDEDKKEDKEWTKISKDSAESFWND